MRLIDAEQCPCNDCVPPLGDSRGCSIFPCREFGEWYKNTAYDVDKVVEELDYIEMKWDKACPPHNEYGEPMCDVDCVECQIRRCKDIVKRGGVDD